MELCWCPLFPYDRFWNVLYLWLLTITFNFLKFFSNFFDILFKHRCVIIVATFLLLLSGNISAVSTARQRIPVIFSYIQWKIARSGRYPSLFVIFYLVAGHAFALLFVSSGRMFFCDFSSDSDHLRYTRRTLKMCMFIIHTSCAQTDSAQFSYDIMLFVKNIFIIQFPQLKWT